jgi:hypothetical protein
MKLWQKQAVNIFFWLFKALIYAIKDAEIDYCIDKADECMGELNAKRADDS